MAMRDCHGKCSREMPHQREARKQAGDREHHRTQHVEQRQSDLAALVEQRRIARERREGPCKDR
jgi:hypothetical protein